MYSDDGGENWSESQRIFSIWDEDNPMVGGSIPQITLLAGQDNSVWIAFAGKYGETEGPEITDVALSSFERGEPWIVSARVTDIDGVVNSALNWLNTDADDPDWEWDEADSVDDDGNGTYWYTMPSDSMHGQAIADGDYIHFFINAEDGLATLGRAVNSRER